MEGFSTFDLILIAVILLLGLKGIINGFIKELFGILGLVGGIFVASRYSSEIGMFIDQNIFKFQNESAISITGFVIGFIVFWAAIILVGKVIQSLTKASGLGSINRLLGFVIGAGKIFLIFSIIAYAISSIEIVKKNSEFLEKSKLYPYLFETGSYIVKFDISSLKSNKTEEAVTESNANKEIETPVAPKSEELVNSAKNELSNIIEKTTEKVNSIVDNTIENTKAEVTTEIEKKIEEVKEVATSEINQTN